MRSVLLVVSKFIASTLRLFTSPGPIRRSQPKCGSSTHTLLLVFLSVSTYLSHRTILIPVITTYFLRRSEINQNGSQVVLPENTIDPIRVRSLGRIHFESTAFTDGYSSPCKIIKCSISCIIRMQSIVQRLNPYET